MREYRESVIEDFVEVETLNEDQFLTVRETVTRLGLRKPPEQGDVPVLSQVVHVFHSKGRHYIVHFKQLFLLDGNVKSTVMTDNDYDNLYSAVTLLKKWGLVKPLWDIPNPQKFLTVVPYARKDDWQLKPNYTIGKYRNFKE